MIYVLIVLVVHYLRYFDSKSMVFAGDVTEMICFDDVMVQVC